MSYLTKFHFVCTNPLELELLKECGCRHVLTSYAFIDHFKNRDLSKHRDYFDTVLIDSGAFTAQFQGDIVDIDEYCQFAKDQHDNYDAIAQLDVIGNQIKTVENYRYMIDQGVDWVMPILTGAWDIGLIEMEKYICSDYNYIGVGGSSWWKKYYNDGWVVARQLPTKYKYHGFAKGNYEAFKHGWLYSIDSSTWSFGARAREGMARVKGQNLGVEFGRKGVHGRNNLRYMHSLLKDDFEACGVDIEKVIEGDYRSLLKIIIPIYYRPLFREISKEMFDANFKF